MQQASLRPRVRHRDFRTHLLGKQRSHLHVPLRPGQHPVGMGIPSTRPRPVTHQGAEDCDSAERLPGLLAMSGTRNEDFLPYNWRLGKDRLERLVVEVEKTKETMAYRSPVPLCDGRPINATIDDVRGVVRLFRGLKGNAKKCKIIVPG